MNDINDNNFFSADSERDRHLMGADMPLREFLLWLSRSFTEQEEAIKYERDSIASQLFYLWLGKAIVDQNEDGLWEEVELEDGEVYISVPIFAAFIKILAKEYMKSKPSFDFVAQAGNVRAASIARACNAFAAHYMNKWFSDEFEQGDILQSFFFGDTLYRICYVDQMEPTQQKEVEEAQWEEVEEGVEEAEVAGQKMVRKGDIYFRGYSGYSWWSNSSAQSFADVNWLRIDEIADWSVIKRAHPNAVLRDGTTFEMEHRSLRQQRMIEKAQSGQQSGFFLNQASHRPHDLTERERIYTTEYFKPVVYAHYEAIDEEKLDGETVLKKGQKLIDAFPNGICIARCGKEIIGLYDVDLHEQYVHARYQVVPNRLHGKSVNDAAELQYTLNEVVSLVVTYGMEVGSPTVLYDEAVIPDGIGVAGKPSLKIPVGNRPPETPMSELVQIIQPGQLSPVVAQLPQMLKEDLQVVLGAFSPFGSGLPDAAGGTATGMAISAEAAASQQAMSLALRANAKKDILQLAIKCFAKHFDDERAFAIVGQYNHGGVLYLKGADLDHDIRVVVRKNSYWPREIYQQQQQIQGYYMAQGLMYQTAMVRGEQPSLAEERNLAELWMVEIQQNIPELAAEIGNERLEAVIDLFERIETGQLAPEEEQMYMETFMAIFEQNLMMAQQQAEINAQVDLQTGMPIVEPVDPMMIMNTVDETQVRVMMADQMFPIRLRLDPHKHLALFYREWGLSWDGRHSPPEVEAWVDSRVAQHEQMMIMDRMSMGTGQQPGMPGMQQPQPQMGGGEQLAMSTAPTAGSSALPTGSPSLPLVTQALGPQR